MEEIMATERTRVKRLPKRASYDREVVHAIIDEAMFCHVGFVHQGAPFVIPTLHVRIGEWLYLHGSAASRMLRTAAGGIPLCVTVTHFGGLILARSAFHHSANYRSAVILGTAQEVTDAAEKTRVLHALVEHVVPGRWRDARPPNPQELLATSVLGLPITEASAKVRPGGPSDEEEDYALPVWAGLIPLRVVPGTPIPDERNQAGVQLPDYVANYRLPNARENGNGKGD
ncbi:MAG TPA: pyridoxamine 5'-phosphate oxidase family protein [Candidatus Binataceae bacterium]|nr:pyridoxamine 5'-phosphate oxidase family protein [Candidatus Binataceae bacterium]